MRRKVTEVLNKKNMNNRYKFIALLTALSISLSSNIVIANDNIIDDNLINNEQSYYEFDINFVLRNIYNQQMKYLVPTIEELKVFYEEKDINNVIKKGYRNAYNVINIDLNYNKIYNGVDYNYISNNNNLVEEINKNNILIYNLNIKSSGSGRDTDYGIIFDEDSKLGFRNKTDEDILLINEYSDIIKDSFILPDSLIILIDNLNKNNDISNLLLSSLEDIYNSQMNYINKIRNNLSEFYNTTDSNLIKDSYVNAYNSYNEDLNAFMISNGTNYYKFIDKDIVNNEYLTDKEIKDIYINRIKRNNIIINNFRIKSNGSGRDSDYNVILDNNSEFGFRIKTNEDKIIIDVYSELVGDIYTFDNSLIKMLESINEYSNKNLNVKKLEK